MKDKFRGTGVALVTPFTMQGDVDFQSLVNLVENVVAQGVNYIVALGTTSEVPTLSDLEKKQVVSTIVNTVNGRVPVVLGLGSNSTQSVIDQMAVTDFTGIDAVLSVAPYYNKPSQEGLYQHFKAISEASPRPVILYNVQGRTSCNIEADTTIRLAQDCPNIVGIKEASGLMNQIMKLVKHTPKDFLVISGDDAITLPLIAAGVDGVISVVANAFPLEVSTMVSLALNNHFQDALQYHLGMLDITTLCFKEGNPSGIKALLSIQGKITNSLRLPLVCVSSGLQDQMKVALKGKENA